MRALARSVAWAAAVLVLVAANAAAQTPPPDAGAAQKAPLRRGAPLRPGGGSAAGGLSNEELYSLLDAFVMTRAQAALQLSEAQYSSFFQRMTRFQTLQRQHRRQRQRILNELRRVVGPNAAEGNDEATVVAKTKELDDLEGQIAVDERKALGEIDDVLQVPQRARLRLFLENMERQKLELLIRARQGRGASPSSNPGPVR